MPDLDIINVYVYNVSMVRVVSRGKIIICVYEEAGGQHHLPHCHVYWDNREHGAQVALPSLTVLAGESLPAAARRLAWEHLEEICDAWNRLNPGRTTA